MIVECDECEWRFSTSRNEKITSSISNQCLTIEELSKKLQISFGSVQTILTADLGVRRNAFQNCS